MQYSQVVQGMVGKPDIWSAISASSVFSASVQTSSGEKVLTFSSRWSMRFMPLSTVRMLECEPTHRKDQRAVLSSGRRAFSWSVSSWAIRPKAPPRSGSMMTFCMPSFSHLLYRYSASASTRRPPRSEAWRQSRKFICICTKSQWYSSLWSSSQSKALTSP